MRITSNFYTKSLILRAKTTSSATTDNLISVMMEENK